MVPGHRRVPRRRLRARLDGRLGVEPVGQGRHRIGRPFPGPGQVVAAVGADLGPDHGQRLAVEQVVEVHWVVLHHGVFQTYYYAHHLGGDRDQRDRYGDHRRAGLCREFCHRWDQSSFDPDFLSHPLDSFEDDLREVLARPACDEAVTGAGTGRLG